ncbi:MAG: hypothetical protein ACFCU4_10305 [Puniceicoccaceae bacterium]
MPIYEYYCSENNTIYSFLAKRLAAPGEIPRCPVNFEFPLERIMSPFSITGAEKKSEGRESGSDDFEDSRMEAAMAELERDMAGMDEENPDPRHLGKLMRRMAELTGEKLDGQMEEMVRKLEEGADPDSLEDEYGDLADDDEGAMGGLSGEETGAPEKAAESSAAGVNTALERALERVKAKQRGPLRDPTLYDWNEYTTPLP